MKLPALLLLLVSTAPLVRALPAPGPDTNLGLYLHLGVDTFRQRGETGRLPADRFRPGHVNPRDWTAVARKAGMGLAMLTAKHESGFCLWPSDGCDYDIEASPCRVDLIGSYLAACQADGILPGLHYSIPDRLNEGTVSRRAPVGAPYFKVIQQHVRELASRYRSLRVLRLDGSERLTGEQFAELGAIVARANPGCALWSEYSIRSCTIPRHWMWSPGVRIMPVSTLLPIYNESRAAALPCLVNVGIDPSGDIPADQVAVLLQFRDEVARMKTPGPAPAAAEEAAAERIRKVKELHRQGLISQEERDRKVREILDSL